MIQVESNHTLADIESALYRAAQNRGAHVIAVTHFDALLGEAAPDAFEDAISFNICHTELYGTLMAADIRFAAFLPCRIAAVRKGDVVTLETMSPLHFCRLLERPELEPASEPLDELLRGLMGDAARMRGTATQEHHGAHSLLGAREGQVNMRASIPQRIDCHGTKVEDLAGTGTIDAPGG